MVLGRISKRNVGVGFAAMILIVLFVSVATVVIVNCLGFLAARLTYFDRADTATFHWRTHSRWSLIRLALETPAVLLFIAVALWKVPLGLIFYVGQ
jgi:hypothetical protein